MDKIKDLEKELMFIHKKLEAKEVEPNEENEIEECSNIVLQTLSNIEGKSEKNSRNEMLDSLVPIEVT